MIEVAIGLVGAALTVLGATLGYIQRADNRLTRLLLERKKALMEG